MCEEYEKDLAFALNALPKGLASQDSVERILSYAHDWPKQLRPDCTGFEFYIEPKQDYIDFYQAFRGHNNAIKHFAEKVQYVGKEWDLFREWFSLESIGKIVIPEQRPEFILELDSGSCREWPPKPNMIWSFVNMAPAVLDHIQSICQFFHPESTRAVLCFLKTIAPNIKRFFLGIMLGRSGYTRLLLYTDINSYEDLKASSLNEIAPFDSLFNCYKQLDPALIFPLTLSINLTDDMIVLPKIGVESYPRSENKKNLNSESIWLETFEAGLAVDSNLDGLSDWLGVHKKQGLVMDPTLFVSGHQYVQSRTIAAGKFICQQGSSVSTKLYLSTADGTSNNVPATNYKREAALSK